MRAFGWPGSATGHVEDIKFVINFDYPNCSEDYVHRIGRTGRSTNTGTAYTFFTPNNAKQAADLVNVLREAKQVISPKLQQLEETSKGMRGGRQRWRGSGGGRFDGRSGGGRFDRGSGGGNRFDRGNSGRNGGGFNSSSGGNFNSQNGSFNSMSGGSSYNKPQTNFTKPSTFSNTGNQYGGQNGNAGGFKSQWNQGGVTANSLASIPPPAQKY